MITFLQSFFSLFNAKIEEHKIINNEISGTIGWANEDDKQDFVFRENIEASQLSTMKLLCDFIIENKLIEGDKIIVPDYELLRKLENVGWDNIKAKSAINKLSKLEVKMIDDGEETDSFYIHW